MFSPHVSILNILGISWRIERFTKIGSFQLAPNQYPISEHYFPKMATTLVGGTLHLQLEIPGFNYQGWQK